MPVSFITFELASYHSNSSFSHIPQRNGIILWVPVGRTFASAHFTLNMKYTTVNLNNIYQHMRWKSEYIYEI